MDQQSVLASIVTIGDELMIGQVIDTNSAWISRQLNQSGFWVRKRVSVGDQYQEMWQALDDESQRSKIILITGGLGPTADDITKPFLCDYFDTTMIVDQDVLKHLQNMFDNIFKRPFIERNRKQAEVPASCTVIHNARGTAPGMLFEKNGVVYISMPGVPHEMMGMMDDLVLPLLRKKFFTENIVHRTMVVYGIGESFLADHIQQWEESLPPYFKLAYLANQGLIRLRITARGNDLNQLQQELDQQFTTLRSSVDEWYVSSEDQTMTQVVSGILKERHQTLGTAESCTGGYLAHLFTREAGASNVFNGTVVSYSNDVKRDILGVQQSTLDTTGAVSEQTVREMAMGALAALKTDYVVATSGIMGPDGGTEAKPVGTVWVAVGNSTRIDTQMFRFRYDRQRNIEMTANASLNFLRKFMLQSDR